MVDVNDYLGDYDAIPNDLETKIHDMCSYRELVGTGFYDLEVEQGTAAKVRSLSTTQGQDTIRNYLFRTLEEIGESILSIDRAHLLEELIDAFNYYLWVMMFDPVAIDPNRLFVVLEEVLGQDWFSKDANLKGHIVHSTVDRTYFLGKATLKCSVISDYLRNRSWMKQSQANQFAGADEMFDFLRFFMTRLILPYFCNLDEFYSYYMAKNDVLKFRLDSNY